VTATPHEWVPRRVTKCTAGVSLLDNLILLAAAALITGLLVPFVSARMNERRVVQQRQADEDLARDSKFIEAQNEFLDTVSTDVGSFAGTMLAVSYYAMQTPEQFANAWRAYDESAFEELFTLRAHVSRAQRLLSNDAQQQLAELHRWLFGDVDPALTSRARALLDKPEAGRGGWSAWHVHTMNELFTRADAALTEIARDVGLIQRRERSASRPG
jgi:hypothetical protein